MAPYDRKLPTCRFGDADIPKQYQELSEYIETEEKPRRYSDGFPEYSPANSLVYFHTKQRGTEGNNTFRNVLLEAEYLPTFQTEPLSGYLRLQADETKSPRDSQIQAYDTGIVFLPRVQQNRSLKRAPGFDV
jgi:hypothetical protein